MISRVATLALVVGLALPAMAAAQTGEEVIPIPPAPYQTQPEEGVPPGLWPPPELGAPASRWPEPAPSLAEGIRDPLRGTVPDDGIVWNGLGLFLGAYVSGLLLTSPFVAVCCGNEAFAAFGLVPFAQWAVGFYQTGWGGAGATIFITGGVFAFWQIFGALILLGGLTHHREVIRPREAGEVSITSDGVEVAF